MMIYSSSNREENLLIVNTAICSDNPIQVILLGEVQAVHWWSLYQGNFYASDLALVFSYLLCQETSHLFSAVKLQAISIDS